MAPDPAVVAQALILVQAQAASRDQVADAVAASARAAVRTMRLVDWFDADAVGRLAKQLSATTRAGQRQTSTSTAAYWARLTRLLSGRRVDPARLVDVAGVRPVPLETLYGRLADQYRWLESSRGPDVPAEERLARAVDSHYRRLERRAATFDAADRGQVPDGDAPVEVDPLDPDEELTAAELARRLDLLVEANPPPRDAPDPLTRDEIADLVAERAAKVADLTLSMTMREQLERAAAKDPGLVTGYRRIIHPELGGTVCGLCIAAATRVYKRGNLLPLHEMCRCTVLPVIGEVGGDGDVGEAINQLDLTRLYEAAGDTTDQQALRRTRFRVIEHPEKGAVITEAGNVLTLLRGGGGKRPARTSTVRTERERGRGVVTAPGVDPATVLRTAQATIADLERRQGAGEDVERKLAYQRNLADRMRAQLGRD